MIRIALSPETLRNGGRISGNATWRADGTKTPRKIDVICRWRVEGKGKMREEIIDRVERADVATEAVIPFEFDIPHHGPLSYDGKLLRIIWEVAVDVDLPMAFDEHQAQTFTVVARKWDPEEWKEGEEQDEEDEEEVV